MTERSGFGQTTAGRWPVGMFRAPNELNPMIVHELSTTDCFAALSAAGMGRLGCAQDNQPYLVPIFFAVQDPAIYAFSYLGQKIEWMRQNPRVCLEACTGEGRDWTSIVLFGRYRELTDTPEHQNERALALSLLQRRAMWWELGALPSLHRSDSPDQSPIFYRIDSERVTGHRYLGAQRAKMA